VRNHGRERGKGKMRLLIMPPVMVGLMAEGTNEVRSERLEARMQK
jgi:hypothetical protein